MDISELARLLDPEAWAATWSTLSEAIEIQTRREQSEIYARRIIDGGYALVKLPDAELDGAGQQCWPVSSHDSRARVTVRASDGRIVQDMVSNPVPRPADARSLAVALLAAADYAEAPQAV
ncbi:hypothetical protein [Nocardia xishanensis]|uniref:hypothetical protein n=1 Tax=Nocardia xishanensis TaxID=238964 RepID=UPI000829B27F|nr:hypothetical protein [Nocardia xishanensis]